MTNNVKNLQKIINFSHLSVNSLADAWELAYALVDADIDEFHKDKELSDRAGYAIYINNDGTKWISDMNTRLEVNFENGDTKNIWVDNF